MELSGIKSAAGTSSSGRDAPTNLYHIDAEGNFVTNSGDILGVSFDSVSLDNISEQRGNLVVTKFEVIPDTGILIVRTSGGRIAGYVVNPDADDNTDSWVLETIHRRGKEYTYVVTGNSEAVATQGNIRGEIPTYRKYVVRKRDTLVKIAQTLLHDGRRWREIHTLNETAIGLDPSNIHPHMVLKVPRK